MTQRSDLKFESREGVAKDLNGDSEGMCNETGRDGSSIDDKEGDGYILRDDGET
jgi:hypothetical protein